jgi:hypothetical protein
MFLQSKKEPCEALSDPVIRRPEMLWVVAAAVTVSRHRFHDVAFVKIELAPGPA